MSSTLVLIPTYNEKNNVTIIAKRIRLSVPHARILFVDDNSPDGTGQLLDKISASDPQISVLHRAGKLGVGSAHLDGISWAYENGFQTLITLDADCTHSPEEIVIFLVHSEQNAVVVGSRFIARGGIAQWPFHRRLITRLGHILTQVFLRIPYDSTGAYRVYNLRMIPQKIFSLVRSKDYAFFYESLKIVDLADLPIFEVPVVLAARFEGNSKMRPRDIRRGITYLVRLGCESAFPLSGLRRAINQVKYEIPTNDEVLE